MSKDVSEIYSLDELEDHLFDQLSDLPVDQQVLISDALSRSFEIGHELGWQAEWDEAIGDGLDDEDWV